MAAARDFGDGFEAELEDDIDEFLIIGDRGFFDDVDAGIFDVATQDKVVFGGLIDGLHLGAHDEHREIGVRLVIARHVDAVVLPIDRTKIQGDVGELLLEAVAISELAFEDDFFHGGSPITQLSNYYR